MCIKNKIAKDPMVSFILVVFIVNYYSNKNLPSVKNMSSELTSLLKRYNLSESDLKIQCEDELFLTLMSKIPSFEAAVPYFGFTPPEIDELQMDNQKVNSRKISMLWKWRSRNGSGATYLAIVKIFLKMGSQELAEIVLKHTGASNPSLMKKPVQVWSSQCLDERIMKLSKQTGTIHYICSY